MIVRLIANLDLLIVFDEDNNERYWGFNQEWYLTEWQRKTGCGPTTACNILSYKYLFEP